VVDDCAVMRQLLVLTLASAGWSVVQAADGLEALDALQRHSCRLVITDQNMPRLDGLAMAGLLRSSPRFAALPIVFHTSECSPPLVQAARAVGVTEWLTKPCSPLRLLAAVDRATRRP
jgi:two-component system chemotaxis response regulator CheY